MQFLFSSDKKFTTWRKLWVALAECEKDLGLPITQVQIAELKQYQDDINYDRAAFYEKKTRHDVMSHVHAYGEQCPTAKAIIHLGATSAYVGDNTDIIVMKEALTLVRKKLVNNLKALGDFAVQYKNMPTLGFTHFQPAQLTTVGKRATLWMMDLLIDFEEVDRLVDLLMLRGVKGTTGTQASFLELFEGDHDKVKALDQAVIKKLGFSKSIPVSGQTYTRKVDSLVLNALSGIAASLHKMTNDVRLLQHLKELEEPFEKDQIGSSAMAYKRNPMRSERISSLAKYVLTASQNSNLIVSTQWFERTLDDSANRRISIPECFLAVDAMLDICFNIASNFVVYPNVIHRRVMSELPFMATENIIMGAVKKGGDRQELHESIRVHSMEAAKGVKLEGKENDLMDRIAQDPMYPLSTEELQQLMDPILYVGRAPEQVDDFMVDCIIPILNRFSAEMNLAVDLKV
jgi:adenylosuccinate lyase